jgi:aquaporin Z
MMSRCLSEVVGTFALVFAGAGAIVVDAAYGGILGHLGICIVFGLIVMAMVYALGNVSGAHINPAVTLAFAVAGRFEWNMVLPYVVCQLLGAAAAAALLRFLFPDADSLGGTYLAVPLLQGIVWEVVISFLLMFVIFNVSTGHMEKGIMAGVAVGGAVALLALLGGPATGASMNPARSFGPLLVAGHFSDLWVFFTAPVVGMLLAIPVCRAIQGEHFDPENNAADG